MAFHTAIFRKPGLPCCAAVKHLVEVWRALCQLIASRFSIPNLAGVQMAAQHTPHHAAELSNAQHDHGSVEDDASNEQDPLLERGGQHLMQESHQLNQNSSSSMSRQQSTHRRHPVASRQGNHSAGDHDSQELSSSSRLGHAEKRARKEGYHEHGRLGDNSRDVQINKEHPGVRASSEAHMPPALQHDPEAQKQTGRSTAEDPWYRQQQVKPASQHACPV